MEKKHYLEKKFNYEKNEVGYILVNKERFNKLNFENLDKHNVIEELLKSLESQDFYHEFDVQKQEVKSFLEKISHRTHFTDLEKEILKIFYIHYKCDLLFNQYWYIFPRYFLSQSYTSLYIDGSKDENMKALLNPLYFKTGSSTSYFSNLINKQTIKNIVQHEDFPLLYWSNNYSSFDPVFMKVAFTTVLDDYSMLVKVDERIINKLNINNLVMHKMYIAEKELLRLEASFLNKEHLITKNYK